MTKKRVQLYGHDRGVEIDIDATPGAVVGVNLFNSDGTLFVPEGAGVPSDEFPTTFWRLIQEIPLNVVALAKTETTGLYTVTGAGTSATREIEVADGELTVSNGDGVAGNPVLGLADVEDTGGGTLQRTAFDAKGRKTGTSAATTDDLPEGAANLYFTDARADARIALQKGQPNGLATLDTDAKLQANQLPALAITETFVEADEAGMLALDAQQGDVCVRTDEEKSYILTAEPASTLANWHELLTPTGTGGTVTSVDLAVPTGFSASGGPVTSSGTLTMSYASGYQGYTSAEASKLSGIEAGAEANAVDSVHGRIGAVVAASGDYTFAQIASTPTTLAGYGITDAATSAQGEKADTAVQPADLAAVATSGDYDDLIDKPVLGTAAAADVGDFATAAQGSAADTSVQPGDLAAVATSGAYSDLSGTPTLGTAAAADVVDFDAAGAASAAQAAAASYTDAALLDYTPTSSLGSAAFEAASSFATAAQGALASTAVQPGDDVSDLTNDAGYVNADGARSAVVVSSITDGDATHAPSGNAVFDALATKANDDDVVHKTGNENVDGEKTFLKNIKIAVGAATGTFALSSEVGQIAEIAFQSSGVSRWSLRGTNAAESGGNSGTNLRLQAKADDGSNLFNVFEVTRSTGVLDFGVRPSIGGSNVLAAGDLVDSGLLTTTPTITNLDTMVGSTARFFRAVGGSTGIPSPVSGSGGVGIYIPYSSTIGSQFWHATTSNRMFMRGYNSGWNAWKEITAV